MKKAISWEEFLHHINKNTKYALIWFIIIVIIIAVVIACSIALPIIYATCGIYGISPNSRKCNEPVYCKNNIRSTSGKCCTNGLTKKSGKYCNQSCKVEQGTPIVLSNMGVCCKYGVTVKGSKCFSTLCTTALQLKARDGNSCACLYGVAPNGECAYKCTINDNGVQINTLLSYSGKCCKYGLTDAGRSDGDGIKKYYCNERCTIDGVQQINDITPYGVCCSLGIAKDGTNCKRNCGSNYLTTDKHWTTSGRCCKYGAAPGLTVCNSSKDCDTTNNIKRTYKGRCCPYGLTKYGYECNAKCDEGSRNTSRGKCCPSANDNNGPYENTCANPKCGASEVLYNIYTTYANNGVAKQNSVCCISSLGVNEYDTRCNAPCNDGTLAATGQCCVSGLTTHYENYNICNKPCCKTMPQSAQNLKTVYGDAACVHTSKGACIPYGFTRKDGIAKNIVKTAPPPMHCTNTTQFDATGICCNSKNTDNKFYKGVAVNTSYCNIPCPNTTKSYNNTVGKCVNCPNGLTVGNTPPTKCNQDCKCGNYTSYGECTTTEIHNKTRDGNHCCATGLALCNNGYKCMETGCEYSGTYDCGKCYPNTTNGHHTKHGQFCGYTRYGLYNNITTYGDKCIIDGVYPSTWQ